MENSNPSHNVSEGVIGGRESYQSSIDPSTWSLLIVLCWPGYNTSTLQWTGIFNYDRCNSKKGYMTLACGTGSKLTSTHTVSHTYMIAHLSTALNMSRAWRQWHKRNIQMIHKLITLSPHHQHVSRSVSQSSYKFHFFWNADFIQGTISCNNSIWHF